MSLSFKLGGLDIQGVHVFSNREAQGILSLQVGDTLDEDGISRAVQELLKAYRNSGYLKAEVNWQVRNEAIFLQIEEGNRFEVRKIKLEGNRFFSGDYILSEFESKKGRIFSQNLLERNIDRLLTRYEDNGFPFCTVKPSDFRLDELFNRIDFTLEINEGHLTRIDGVKIVGNETTRDWIIRRELKIKEKEVYSRKRIEDALNRLGRTNVIEVQGYELQTTRDGWVIVQIRIEEKRPNSVEGVIGWAPKEKELTGLVNLRADNLFGTLRSFRFQWIRKQRLSSYLHFVYREPWLFGSPLIGELDVETIVEDTSYTVHSGSIHLFATVPHPFIVGVGVGMDKVTALKAPIPNSNEISLTFHSGVDTRDSPSTPTRGICYNISSKHALKFEYPSPGFQGQFEEKSWVTKTECELLNFIAVKKDIIYVRIGGGRLSAKGASSTWEEFTLGGAATVRGYREEQFVAPQVGWLNLEYRLTLEESGWLSPFFDLGHYRKARTEWIYGWGIGLGLTSKLGLVTIYYGLGREGSFGDGKIHFGLLTLF